jgi:lysyl endopeptidase
MTMLRPARFVRILAATFFGVAISSGVADAGAQPVVLGERAIAPEAVPAPRLRIVSAKATGPRIELSPVADSDVNEVRRANARGGFKNARRVVIGLTRAGAALPTVAPMQWTAVDGGRAAQVAVTSPEAGSLRLAIDLAGVPQDVEMVFFGSDLPSRLEGPIRVGEIRDRTAPWWSPLTEGATQTVEFFVPSRLDPSTLAIRITGASHIFTTPSSRFTKRIQDIGSSGSCNVDVPCSALNATTAFQNVADSVAQMVFTDGAFTALCTGSLLNDSDGSTQLPWFYSANHCFDNESPPYKTATQMQSVANTLATLWSFEANNCINGHGSGVPVSTWSQLNGGATYIFSNVQSDALFVRLNNAPPAGAFFSGWDANPVTAGTAVIAIHHPEGDLKKVTQGTMLGFSTPHVGGGSNPFIEVRWSLGTTEPGSSGSGLWTFNGTQYLLRGGLWGGEALCTNMAGTDNFSRFDQVYPALAAYLGASGGGGGGIDYTDLWWNPAESGWGLQLVQHPSGMIFGVWYTYDADGKRTWFVLPSGSWTSSNVYSGVLYATAGPAYDGPFNPALVQRTPVGTATLTFTDTANGTFAFSVNGVGGVKTIKRIPY